MTIPTHLIEKALALGGKTMEDMLIPKYKWGAVVNGMAFTEFDSEFSIEKFYAYLLSPEFIHEYYGKYGDDVKGIAYPEDYYPVFGTAIGQYQKGNPKPLLSLLQKI